MSVRIHKLDISASPEAKSKIEWIGITEEARQAAQLIVQELMDNQNLGVITFDDVEFYPYHHQLQPDDDTPTYWSNTIRGYLYFPPNYLDKLGVPPELRAVVMCLLTKSFVDDERGHRYPDNLSIKSGIQQATGAHVRFVFGLGMLEQGFVQEIDIFPDPGQVLSIGKKGDHFKLGRFFFKNPNLLIKGDQLVEMLQEGAFCERQYLSAESNPLGLAMSLKYDFVQISTGALLRPSDIRSLGIPAYVALNDIHRDDKLLEQVGIERHPSGLAIPYTGKMWKIGNRQLDLLKVAGFRARQRAELHKEMQIYEVSRAEPTRGQPGSEYPGQEYFLMATIPARFKGVFGIVTAQVDEHIVGNNYIEGINGSHEHLASVVLDDGFEDVVMAEIILDENQPNPRYMQVDIHPNGWDPKTGRKLFEV